MGVAGVALLACAACAATRSTAPAPVAVGVPPEQATEPVCARRLDDPARTVVERPCGTRQAVLTDGARSVVLVGPSRRFHEASARDAVVTTAWVRLLPAPFGGTLDSATSRWLEAALLDRSPDIFALALQYLDGAPPIVDAQQRQIAGDADYGPLGGAGTRDEGADFNDYLGATWLFPGGRRDRPHADRLHSLDCSGYMRMVWGYRGGLPLGSGAAGGGDAIPRRAAQMSAAAPGVVIIAASATAGAALDRLQPGDLVFFDADPSDGAAIDHVGMFLDKDEGGHHRFISSRKGANGPTMGDVRGASLLDGAGLYARSFRAARRL